MSFIVAGCALLLALLAGVLVDDLPSAAPFMGAGRTGQIIPTTRLHHYFTRNQGKMLSPVAPHDPLAHVEYILLLLDDHIGTA